MNSIYSSLALDATWDGKIITPIASKYLHILAALETQPWAMTPAMLRTMIHRLHGEATELEAVAAKTGKPLDNTGGQVTMRGRTAVLAIEGPIFRYANVLTALSGATSVEMSALAFQQALDNPQVDNIVLAINSPGGEVDGINSFADQIRAGTAKKPVTAFVDGLGASAAYWLAAAATNILADESSFLGSIGVVATMIDRSGAQERQGVKSYTIVSSQSPRKRPDPGTDEGRAQIQEMVDSTADLFISRIADFRGVSADTVMANYGGGSVLPARKALAAGMIDGIRAFEPFLAATESKTMFSIPAAAAANSMEVNMPETAVLPAGAASPPSSPPNLTTSAPPLTTGGSVTLGNTSPSQIHYVGSVTGVVMPSPEERERERIRAILNLPEAHGRDGLAQHLALNTSHSPEEAQAILKSAPMATATPAPRNEFERQMALIGNPKVGTGEGSPNDDSAASEAARVLQFVPKGAKYASS